MRTQDLPIINEQKKNRDRWTAEEIEILKQAVQEKRFDWLEIASQFENRNANQCAQKWKRLKCQRSRKHQFWTEEEDDKLKNIVCQVGKRWSKVAKLMENRNEKQCRDRYLNSLDPNLKCTSFTNEEDHLIYELFLIHGSKWSTISKFLEGRSDIQIKNRFYTHIREKFLQIRNPYYTKQTKEDNERELETTRQYHLTMMNQENVQFFGDYNSTFDQCNKYAFESPYEQTNRYLFNRVQGQSILDQTQFK